MATAVDRARASRIRGKGASASAEETAWLADFEQRRARARGAKAAPVIEVQTAPEPAKEIVEHTLPPIEAPIDPGPSIEHEEIGEPDRVIFYDDAKSETAIEKVSDAGSVTGFVASSTAASVFLLTKTGWSIFGDRVHVEPDAEESALMTKVITSYAQRYGWTQEMDDALLLGTVLLSYNARCFRAPKKDGK